MLNQHYGLHRQQEIKNQPPQMTQQGYELLCILMPLNYDGSYIPADATGSAVMKSCVSCIQ